MIKCEKCGKELYYGDSILALTNGGFVCGDCSNDNDFILCECCHRVQAKKEKHPCICNISDVNIHQYGYKPKGLFKTLTEQYKYRNKERYYGLELELNNLNVNVAGNMFKESINNIDCYLKSDSSIANGVEVVTVPMSKKYMLNWLDTLDDAWRYLGDCDGLKENAGLHIHISKNSMSFENIIKLGLLTNTRETNTINDALTYIGRRYEDIHNPIDTSYCNKSHNSIRECLQSSHTACVNFSPKATIEFRCFRSTTNKDYIKDYINLVDRTLLYVDVTPIKDLSLRSYLDWLSCFDRFTADTKELIADCYKLLYEDNTSLDFGTISKEFVSNINCDYHNWIIYRLSRNDSYKDIKSHFGSGCQVPNFSLENRDIDYIKLRKFDIDWVKTFVDTRLKFEEEEKERLFNLLCA